MANGVEELRPPRRPDVPELPTNEGSDIGSLITQETLGQFQPKGPGSPSAEDLATVERLIEAQTPGVETGDLGRSTFFPGIDQPINVGQVGGQLIGSQPIFVRTGGQFPVGVVEARKKALEDAAKKKAQALKSFDIPKGPTIKDPRFQRSLNKTVTSTQENFINRARQQFGEKAFIALQSPQTSIGREFINAMDNLDVLAREGDQIVDLFAEVETGLESGDLIFSDETIKLKQEFETLSGQLEGGQIGKLGNMRDKLNALRGSLNLDKFLNDKSFLTDIKGRLVEKAGVRDFNEYLQTTKVGTKTFDEDVATIASNLKRTSFKNNPFFTEDQIASQLGAILGSERTIDISIKTKAKGAGSKIDPNETDLNLQPEKTFKTGDKTVNGKNFVPVKSTDETINVSGAKVLNERGEEIVIQEGTQNMVPVGLVRATFNKDDGTSFDNNVLVVKQKVQQPKLDTKGNPITKTTFDDLGNQVTVAETEDVEVTRYIDVESSRARLQTDIPNALKFFEEKAGRGQETESVPGFGKNR